MGLFHIEAGSIASNPVSAFSNKHIEANLSQLRERFDITIIASPATAIAPESIRLMGYVVACFFLLRAGKTPRTYLSYPDLLGEEYGFKHLQLVLNGVHQGFNYDGRYAGSRYSYKVPVAGFFKLLPHYIKSYVR